MALGNILALILSIADFFTEGLFFKATENKMKFISFAAGISVSYIFLILLPEIYLGAVKINNMLFLAVLFGFGLYHIIEKYIRQNYSGQKLREEHHIIHSTVSFSYFFVVGFILYKIAEISPIKGILLFIPVLLHIIIDSLPRRITKKHHIRAASASSAFLGSIAAIFIDVREIGNVILLGFVGGALLYSVIRESLPKEREGKPLFFLIGLLLFTVIILLLWNVGF